MYQVVVAAVVAVSVWAPEPAAAQLAHQDSLLAPLVSVMGHRFTRDDSTPFQACQIHEELGRPDRMIERLGSAAALLDRQELACDTPPDPAGWAEVREYLVGHSVAYVVLLVVKPGLSYLEDYRLQYSPENETWSVEEVRLHSRIQYTR